MQKTFLSYVVKPTFEAIKDIAPLSFELADGLISQNLDSWAAIAAAGDRGAVIGEGAEQLHVSPMTSPFHSSNQASWCARGHRCCKMCSEPCSVRCASGPPGCVRCASGQQRAVLLPVVRACVLCLAVARLR